MRGELEVRQETDKERSRRRAVYWFQAALAAVGVALIATAQFGLHTLQRETHVWASLLLEIASHIGVGFLVAAAVSLIFDTWYHERQFGEPIHEIDLSLKSLQSGMKQFDEALEGRLGVLSTTVNGLSASMSDQVAKLEENVAEFSQVLRTAQANGLDAIHRRNAPHEKVVWKERVASIIRESDQFVLIVARTMDDLLPTTHRDHGLAQLLKQKMNAVPVVVLLADTYCTDSDFRLEAEKRAPSLGASIYGPNRDTVRQLLDMANEANAWERFSMRLLQKGPPFALFMTEKRALVEPYLPFEEGGEGLVFEVRGADERPHGPGPRGRGLYEAHRRCFGHLYSSAKTVHAALTGYSARKKDDSQLRMCEKYMPLAEKVAVFEAKAVEQARLYS